MYYRRKNFNDPVYITIFLSFCRFPTASNAKHCKDPFYTKLIPTCIQRNLLSKFSPISADTSQNDDSTCTDFIPSFSNHGLCLTKNGADLDTLFHQNEYLGTFKKVFNFQEYHKEIKNIAEQPSEQHMTFIIDGDSFKNLKRGSSEWNSSSYTEFRVGLHSPTDVADIRGWDSKIINVPTGFVTSIKVDLSEQKGDSSIRPVSVSKRGCKFNDENEDLSSIKWYSKINCFVDCKMDIGEKVCGCRPWDYPRKGQHNTIQTTDPVRICDFFGSSCFNKILSRNMEEKCKRRCSPECDKIGYKMVITKESLNLNNRICGFENQPYTNLEQNLKMYMLSQFWEDNIIRFSNVDSGYALASGPPEKRILNLMRDVLSSQNVSYYSDQKKAFERDCKEKLNSDIAVVIVSIDSPTFDKTTKRVQVTMIDKLGVLGI